MASDRSADRHTTPRRPVSLGEEWAELGQLVGDRNRSEVIRQLVRAFLKKPGAKMPKRSDYEKLKDGTGDQSPS